jgi:hypothetical protein
MQQLVEACLTTLRAECAPLVGFILMRTKPQRNLGFFFYLVFSFRTRPSFTGCSASFLSLSLLLVALLAPHVPPPMGALFRYSAPAQRWVSDVVRVVWWLLLKQWAIAAGSSDAWQRIGRLEG